MKGVIPALEPVGAVQAFSDLVAVEQLQLLSVQYLCLQQSIVVKKHQNTKSGPDAKQLAAASWVQQARLAFLRRCVQCKGCDEDSTGCGCAVVQAQHATTSRWYKTVQLDNACKGICICQVKFHSPEWLHMLRHQSCRSPLGIEAWIRTLHFPVIRQSSVLSISQSYHHNAEDPNGT